MTYFLQNLRCHIKTSKQKVLTIICNCITVTVKSTRVDLPGSLRKNN